jgi:glycosyltransferase involved in cell wall biosynthesis
LRDRSGAEGGSVTRLRIAAFARVMPEHLTGGMPIITEHILQGLAGIGHDVVLFTTDRPGQTNDSEVIDSRGMQVHYLRTGAPGRYSNRWFRSLDSAVRAAHVERPFDVLVSVSAAARGLLTRWRGAGIRAPSVVLTFGTHLDEVRAGLHSIRGHLSLAGVAEGLARAGHTVYRAVRDVPFMRSPDAFIVPCPGDRLKISRMFGYPADRIGVIPYGVGEALLEQLVRTVDPRSNLVTVVARLARDKGIQTALGAMREVSRALPGARLRVVGDGSYRPGLEKLAAGYGLRDRVEFTGMIPFERIAEAYAGAAVVLNPRLRPTAYDHAMVVGMATGLPVISSDLGDTGFIAKPGVEAVYVPAGDERALAEAIRSCLTDRDHARQVGTAGLAAVRQRLTMERTVSRYSAFLTDLAERRTPLPV